MLDLPPLAPPPDLARLLSGLAPAPPLDAALAHAWTNAPYLRGLIRSQPALVAEIIALGFDAPLAATLAEARGATDDPALRLRRAKRRVALIVALADLSGAWPLERVTRALSDLADLALDIAIAAALAERGAPNRGLVALALGKLGSHELNYSSDVDLILLYEPPAIPVRDREDPADAAVRIAKRAVAIIADQTPDGYVFRVDLRLRPASEVTPIALPVAAAEHYYQSEALTWERTAFIRARACAGDVALGQAFLRAIDGFVWRRSLDYTAIRDIQAVSLRIRDHFDAGQALGPGFDLKRGRGGIREVEFFAQLHQLVWGGREPGLRTPATLDALAALAASGRIGAAEAATLSDSYRLLRGVEHRLQMLDDAQTHSIPAQVAARTALARLCGEADWRGLERRLKAATAPVAAAFDRLIAEAGGHAAPTLPSEPAALARALGKPGKALAPMIARWRAAPYRALRAEPARASFEALLPRLVDGLTAAVDPGQAAARLDRFLAQLPAGAQFFALLEANPPLVDLLGRLLGVTPVLADALARTPALFDVLLGRDAFDPLPPAAALAAELDRAVAGAGGLEDVLDRVRRWTGERRFQLGAQLIEGRADPLRVGRDLGALADAAVALLAARVTDDFAGEHGRVAGGGLIVVAMGRYGGGVLSHASDLDLVYLFTGTHDAVSDGAKPLAATQYFNRLAARLSGALSAPTAAGALYEVDTRLRPFGAKGLLAVSVDSFLRYQADEAETWEHMALTRARVVAGDATAVAPGIAAVLTRPPPTLAKQVLAMRAEIAAAKPGQGRFDVKLAPGGLVDLEFLIHCRQLARGAALTPDLAAAVAALAPGLAAAHDVLTRALVTLRLVAPDGAPGPAAKALLARLLGVDDAEAAVTAAKASVRAAWAGLVASAAGDADGAA